MIWCYSSDYVWVHLYVRLHSSFKACSGIILPDVELKQDVRSVIILSNTYVSELSQSQESNFSSIGLKGFSAESNVLKPGCGFFFLSCFSGTWPRFPELNTVCTGQHERHGINKFSISNCTRVCSYQKTDLEIGNKNETCFKKK